MKLGKHPLLGFLQERYDLLFGNGGEPIKKIRNRFACLQVIDQCLDGNTGASENGGSSHDFRNRTDDARLHTIFVGENGWKVKAQLTTQEIYFAAWINDRRHEASREVGKLHRIIPDEEAESHGSLRVVDERGEDYGYSVDRFFRLEVPCPLERALLRASSRIAVLVDESMVEGETHEELLARKTEYHKLYTLQLLEGGEAKRELLLH